MITTRLWFSAKRKKKPHKDDDIGGDAMELALKQARRQAQKEEKTP